MATKNNRNRVQSLLKAAALAVIVGALVWILISAFHPQVFVTTHRILENSRIQAALLGGMKGVSVQSSEELQVDISVGFDSRSSSRAPVFRVSPNIVAPEFHITPVDNHAFDVTSVPFTGPDAANFGLTSHSWRWILVPMHAGRQVVDVTASAVEILSGKAPAVIDSTHLNIPVVLEPKSWIDALDSLKGLVSIASTLLTFIISLYRKPRAKAQDHASGQEAGSPLVEISSHWAVASSTQDPLFRLFRLVVRNKARRPIRVRAELIRIFPQHAQYVDYLPVPLHWMHDNDPPYHRSQEGWSIEPGADRQVDVVQQRSVDGRSARWEIWHALIKSDPPIRNDIPMQDYSLTIRFRTVDVASPPMFAEMQIGLDRQGALTAKSLTIRS